MHLKTMCICINCVYVNQCAVYNIVKQQHREELLYRKHSFVPHRPIFHISIYYGSKTRDTEWDVAECLSFVEQPGNWLHAAQN